MCVISNKLEHVLIDNGIPAVCHIPQSCIPRGLVISLHGLISHKGSIKFVRFCDEAAARGFIAVRFDQAGAGQNTTNIKKGLVSARLENVIQVYKYMLRKAGSLPLFLFGSSFGGYLAYIFAATTGKSSAVASWAAPFDVQPVRGILSRMFPCLSDPLGHPHSLADLNPLAFSVSRALVIHGASDDIVPFSEANRIYEYLGLPKKLLLFKGTDHRFLDDQSRSIAIKVTLEWFEKFV